MEKHKLDYGYLYNDSFTEKDFIRAVINKIKDDNLSPSYIFDEMTFDNVSRINIPLILAGGNSKIEYSRMIGYDRYITTTKYKTTTYGNGFQNKTQSSSTRTVTDWQNDYGVIEGTASSGYFDKKYEIYDKYVTNHKMDKNNISQLPSDEMDKYALTNDIVEFLENDILNKVFVNNITYPGNHVKNEQYNGTTNLYDVTCTIVSLYALKVTIRDEEIIFIACSNGEIDIETFGEYPADNFDESIKFSREITAQRNEATKRERTIAKYTIISTIVLFILMLILGISLKIIALTIISFIILIIGSIIGIKYLNDVKKISKPYYKKIYDFNMNDFENKQKHKEESYQRYIKENNI